MKKTYRLFLIGVILCFFATSCKDKKDVVPILPPSNSIAMDFSYFSLTKSENKGLETTYFEAAAGIVQNWVPITKVVLDVPISAFEALTPNDSKKQSLSNNTWQWKYTDDGHSVVVTAVVGPSTKWTFNVDGTDCITGTTDSKGTSGEWELRAMTSENTPLLKVDWSSSNSSRTILSYTCLSGSYSGNTITYSPEATSTTYSNTFEGKDGNDNYCIEWNPTVGGRVRSQASFGNSEWHKWNANKTNVSE